MYKSPDYNQYTRDSDIALLEVSREIPFPVDNSIAPVCLPYQSIYNETGRAIATGWGVTYPGNKAVLARLAIFKGLMVIVIGKVILRG